MMCRLAKCEKLLLKKHTDGVLTVSHFTHTTMRNVQD